MFILVEALAFSGGTWDSQELPKFLACACTGTKGIKTNKTFWHWMSWKSLIQCKPTFFSPTSYKGKESDHVGVIEKGVWVPFGLCLSVFSLVISEGGGVADTNTRDRSAWVT